MHPMILAERNAVASNRIVASAQTLAGIFDLDTATVERLSVRHAEPALQELFRREAVADLLENLVGQSISTETHEPTTDQPITDSGAQPVLVESEPEPTPKKPARKGK